MNPPDAKREQRFSAEGGRKPRWKGGSAVKDDRHGGAPGLHKRGFASAEDRGGGRAGRRRESLTARGMLPSFFRTRGREGAVAVRQDRKEIAGHVAIRATECFRAAFRYVRSRVRGATSRAWFSALMIFSSSPINKPVSLEAPSVSSINSNRSSCDGLSGRVS